MITMIIIEWVQANASYALLTEALLIITMGLIDYKYFKENPDYHQP